MLEGHRRALRIIRPHLEAVLRVPEASNPEAAKRLLADLAVLVVQATDRVAEA